MNRGGIGRWSRSLVAAGACLLASAAIAADKSPDDWQFGLNLYVWGANIDTQAGDEKVEIRFTDLVDSLELAGMGTVEARKGRWYFLTDVIYLDAQDNIDESTAIPGVSISQLGLESWIVTGGAGVTFYETDKHWAATFFGVQYLWIDLSLETTTGPPLPPGTNKDSGSDGIFDAVWGVRGRYGLPGNWFIPYTFTVGAGDSKYTYQALGGIGYQLGRWDIAAGYRYLDWKFQDSNAIDGVLRELDLSGGYVGTRINF